MEQQQTGGQPRVFAEDRPDEDGRAELGRRAPPTPSGQSQAVSRTQPDRDHDLVPLLVRPETAARLLGLSRSKTYEMIVTGELPSVTIGRARRIPRAALLEWVDARLDEQR